MSKNSDLILFTGDIINNKSSELIKWKDLLSTMKASDGKFSVLKITIMAIMLTGITNRKRR